MLSNLTVLDVAVPTETELLEMCGSDKYLSSLLLMLVASHITPSAPSHNDDKNHTLLKVKYLCTLFIVHKITCTCI